jgi:3-hydroxybutyryl-CoA dehydrogenase
VIGSGVIGLGVAQSLAETGHEVVLVDRSDQVLKKSRLELKNSFRLFLLLKKDKPQIKAQDLLDRVRFTTRYQDLDACEFIIENVPEKWEIKKSVFESIEKICSDRTCFASNTSAIPITRIASVLRKPERLLGLHFMNPVPLKNSVELIRGLHTSEATVGIAQELLAQMGKNAVIVNDSPGFVSNRVLMVTINEAIFLLQEGVASVEAIDTIFRNCFGHKMGPLETADLIGLDTILYSIEVLHDSFSDSKYRPCPFLRQMVAAGLLGKKSGEGFYEYHRQEH